MPSGFWLRQDLLLGVGRFLRPSNPGELHRVSLFEIRRLTAIGRFPPQCVRQAVVADSPADTAGLRPNDLVLKIAGQGISTEQDLFDTVASITPGRRVPIEVQRGTRVLELDITLEERTLAKALRR